jgi:hypothetical protein
MASSDFLGPAGGGERFNTCQRSLKADSSASL